MQVALVVIVQLAGVLAWTVMSNAWSEVVLKTGLCIVLGGMTVLAAAYVAGRVAKKYQYCRSCAALMPSGGLGLVAGTVAGSLLVMQGHKALGITLASVAGYPVALCAVIALIGIAKDSRPGCLPPMVLGAGVSPLLALPALLIWPTLLTGCGTTFLTAISLWGWVIGGLQLLRCHE